MQKSVYIETYGCSNNKAESEMMAGILEKSGFVLTSDEKTADIVVVNTCSVKNKTENKIISRLERLSVGKKKLIVAGCLPEANIERVRKVTNGSTAIVSTNHIGKIAVAADLLMENELVEFIGKNKEEKIGLPKISANSVVDIVPISNGCMSHCNFCSTKIAKGDLFSYSENHIIDEIKKRKIAGGAKEFWLTSQDCGCYGFDTNTNAALLLSRITKTVPGTYFIRLGMANPQHVKRIMPELISAFKNDHVFRFLHIPVQHGSNEVLRKMARGHTVEDYKNVVSAFRSEFPDITIWTDVIVGYPEETEEDFQKTIELVKETRPDVCNISAYSPRPGTRAAKMEKVKTDVVKERTRALSLIAKQIYLENNKKWLGWSGSILIDEKNDEKNSFIGRNYAYKPVVVNGRGLELGRIVDVTVTEATSQYLIAEIR